MLVVSDMVGSHAHAAKAVVFFVLMIRRPPRSTLDRSSAASDVYKRQMYPLSLRWSSIAPKTKVTGMPMSATACSSCAMPSGAVSYTHLRAHETVLDLVCRLLLENQKIVHTHLVLHDSN